ncbi:MAG: hypothetical protein ABIZ70_11570 [Gemmatimonadales bacterium]
MSAFAARCTALITLAGGAVAVLPAQNRPTFVLDKGAVEFPESFSKVSQVVELRDGRVLLLDAGEGSLLAVDFAKKSSTKVSRQGGGPLEYRAPGFLLGSAADTLIYFDMMQSRFLLLSSAAAPLATARFGSGASEAMLSGMMPSAMDARGRIYGVTSGFSMGASDAKSRTMPNIADTVEIQRLDRRSGATTTLARIRNITSRMKPKVEPDGAGMKLTMTAPDGQAMDAWTVLPDGRIAALRDGIYRVHFLADGGKDVLGPEIPYVAVVVTASERKAIVDSMRLGMERMMAASRKAFSAAAGASGKAAPKFEAVVLEPAKWAATKAAYTNIISSPDGLLWVSLSGPTGSRVQRFDVLNGTGALLAHVQLASGESIVGWGHGTIYTIRMDDDDLQYLRRHTLPVLK